MATPPSAQAYTPFSQMPIATAINGTEILCASLPQPFSIPPFLTETLTVAQLAAYIALLINGGHIVPIGYVSMRQLKAALAFQNELVPLFDNLPGDMNNEYNITWWSGSIINATDIFITGFLQPTLGYSNAQVVTLLALAQTYPL